MVSANGSPIKSIGTIKFIFKVGTKSFHHEFLVCKDLSGKCILGLDFLFKNKCHIDFDRKFLICDGEKIPLFDNYIESKEYPEVNAFWDSIKNKINGDRNSRDS